MIVQIPILAPASWLLPVTLSMVVVGFRCSTLRMTTTAGKAARRRVELEPPSATAGYGGNLGHLAARTPNAMGQGPRT